MRIALLEDHPVDATLLQTWVQGAGHQCEVFTTARALMEGLSPERHDLLLIDWELPDIPGDHVLGWVREHVGWELPVIFVTGRDATEDVVAMLEAGADDYITKPVNFKELLARITSLGRRSRIHTHATLCGDCAPFQVDARGRRILRDGVEVQVTPKEFQLAVALLGNIGTLLERRALMKDIWGYGPEVNSRTIDIHVSRLRKKMALVPEHGWRLTSVHNEGYRLDRLDRAQSG